MILPLCIYNVLRAWKWRIKALLAITRPTVCGSPLALQHLRIVGKGKIIFGRNVQFGWPLASKYRCTEAYVSPRNAETVIEIGSDCVFNNGASLCAESDGVAIKIGNGCLFGPNFSCVDSDFHGVRLCERNSPTRAAVEIGDNCFFGDNVTVLKGVHLGARCVVGSHAVVTKSFPEDSLLAGNPAKFIRKIEQ